MTRTHVRLLGPCFKTGRRGRRPTRNRDADRASKDARYTRLLHYLPAAKPGNRGFNTRKKLHPVPWYAASSSLREALEKCSHQNKLTTTQSPCGSQTQQQPIRQPEPPAQTSRNPSVYHYTVSRTIELSLQSSFQLSLTVLVRYRSRGHI